MQEQKSETIVTFCQKRERAYCQKMQRIIEDKEKEVKERFFRWISGQSSWQAERAFVCAL